MYPNRLRILYCIMLFREEYVYVRGYTGSKIVYPTLAESRDSTGTKVVRINGSLTLTLQRSDFLGKELTLSSVKDGEWRHDVVNTAVFGLHEDPEHFSSLLVHELENGVQLRGIVTPSLHIEPLYTMERSLRGQVAHRLYEVREDSHLPVASSGTQQKVSERMYLWHPYYGYQLPVTIWMEVLVVCDFEHRAAFKSDEEHTTYVVIFMRSVTLRFVGPTPRIRFRLIALHRTAQEESNTLLGLKPGNNSLNGSVDGEVTLENFKGFMEKRRISSMPDVDIAYLITRRYNIIEYIDENKKEPVFVPGMSYEGGVCSEKNVGMGFDDAKFYFGVDTAVRQMAHLLGAPWDDNTEGCKWTDGFIMGDISHQYPKAFTFSECSKKGMQETLLDRLNADIAFKKANPLNSEESDERGCFDPQYFDQTLDVLGSKLPGEVVDQTEFCRVVMPYPEKDYIHLCENWFQNTREWPKVDCVTRCCYGSGWTLYQQIAYKSLDGFKCYLSRQICYAGRCVDSGTNINTYG
ncbi:A disintegrin and metalloproteinase with thrombospondin motifs like [Ornithodoros turicata]|uniref:A disintegrin and metalloproteinase with thrombospondin motifs like n=1 Tax=Ornithodoros turicata TaxID=34597 RepID=UPI003139EC55